MDEIVKAASVWQQARSALVNMPMNSPDWRAKLNDLSNAENALALAVRAAETKPAP